MWVRYLLFQLPGVGALAIVLLALGRWMGLSVGAALIILVLWIAKDLLLYPLLKDAYRKGGTSASERLVGRRAIVESRLDPEGYVRIGSELWRAEAFPITRPLDQGARVRVRSVDGLTVRVEEDPES